MTIAPAWLCQLWRQRFLRRNARSSDELDAATTRRLMASRLLAQIQYFGARADALPEWKEAARITDPEALWRIWPTLPVVTKSMLGERFPAESLGPRFGLDGRVDSTGGSTGEPTRFFHDRAMMQ